MGKGGGRLSGEGPGAASAVVRGNCAEARDRVAQDRPGPAGRRKIEERGRTSKLDHGVDVEPQRPYRRGSGGTFARGFWRLVFWISQPGSHSSGATATARGRGRPLARSRRAHPRRRDGEYITASRHRHARGNGCWQKSHHL